MGRLVPLLVLALFVVSANALSIYSSVQFLRNGGGLFRDPTHNFIDGCTKEIHTMAKKVGQDPSNKDGGAKSFAKEGAHQLVEEAVKVVDAEMSEEHREKFREMVHSLVERYVEPNVVETMVTQVLDIQGDEKGVKAGEGVHQAADSAMDKVEQMCREKDVQIGIGAKVACKVGEVYWNYCFWPYLIRPSLHEMADEFVETGKAPRVPLKLKATYKCSKFLWDKVFWPYFIQPAVAREMHKFIEFGVSECKLAADRAVKNIQNAMEEAKKELREEGYLIV